MSLFGGSTEHFGLDIGTEAVRVVKLSGNESKFTLDAFGLAMLPPGLSQSDSKIDQQKLAKIIDELLKRSQIDTKNVIAAIPGTSVFNTTVRVPNMSQSELEKAVRFQAEQNLPVKLDEVKYDWQVIKQDPQTKELVVMIIAATKGKVMHMMDLFKYAGLNVLALETSTVGMARSLTSTAEPLAMVLDIGSTTTEIAIIEKGILMQTRSFPLGGIAMTRAVAQNLRLDQEQAELFKKKFGLSQDKLEGQVFRAIDPILKNILDEAVRSSKFYEEQFKQKVNRVILTGGVSRLGMISEYIKNYLGMEVSFGNPWTKVSFNPSYNDKLNEVAPDFATAVGLAMRD
jgi:type IV pilus assembly protein PilM